MFAFSNMLSQHGLLFCSIQAKSTTLPFTKYKMENICNGNRKKYLVSELPDNLPQYKYRKIEQGYLSTSPVVRVRMDNDKYYLTYKGKGLLAREEYNLPLTKESYEHLIQKADGNIITKNAMKFLITADILLSLIYLKVFLAEQSLPKLNLILLKKPNATIHRHGLKKT